MADMLNQGSDSGMGENEDERTKSTKKYEKKIQ